MGMKLPITLAAMVALLAIQSTSGTDEEEAAPTEVTTPANKTTTGKQQINVRHLEKSDNKTGTPYGAGNPKDPWDYWENRGNSETSSCSGDTPPLSEKRTSMEGTS